MQKVLSCFVLVIILAQGVQAQCFQDRHTTNAHDGWISCEKSLNPVASRGNTHWIRYDFGQSYPLHDLTVWNMNHPEFVDDGIKDVIIEYSSDGTSWSLADTLTIPRAPASGFYEGVLCTDLEGVNARYLLLTALDNYGGGCYGLSEIKVYTSDQQPTEFELAFSPCERDGVLRNITGGMEMNGTYSGPGVADNGNESFDFDPGTAGPGIHEITYTHGGGTLTADITVLPCTDPICANCPDCGDFDQNMVNNNPIPEDIYYDDVLSAAGTVANNQPVKFRGMYAVEMNAGFEVEANTDFIAEIRDCEENIILNGGFEHEGQDWEFFVSPWNPVSATIEYDIPEPYTDEKTAKIQVTQSDGAAWQVALNQYYHTIEVGYEYEFSFYAREVSGGDVILHIQQDDDPNYHTFEWERIDNLTNLWQKYSYSFTPSQTINNTVRVRLQFGETTGEWYFDRITMTRKPTN